MIQSRPYQFEPELFTNLRFALLRNAVQPLILILSHRNCHAWSYTKTNMHQSAIYRTTNVYMFRMPGIPHRHGQISTPYEIQKIICVKPCMCFFKTKREKIVRTSREWTTMDEFSGLGITSVFCPTFFFQPYANYRKRHSDTWWLLSMRLRTRLSHRQYLFLCKAYRRSIEVRANQIVGCWSWISQACVSVTFQ